MTITVPPLTELLKATKGMLNCLEALASQEAIEGWGGETETGNHIPYMKRLCRKIQELIDDGETPDDESRKAFWNETIPAITYLTGQWATYFLPEYALHIDEAIAIGDPSYQKRPEFAEGGSNA